MNVIAFPRTAQQAAPEAATVPDTVLHELLRKAVAAHGAGAARTPGSIAHRHHLAICMTILDAIETVLGVPAVAMELSRSLNNGITDVRRLAGTARRFTGPEPA